MKSTLDCLVVTVLLLFPFALQGIKGTAKSILFLISFLSDPHSTIPNQSEGTGDDEKKTTPFLSCVGFLDCEANWRWLNCCQHVTPFYTQATRV